MGNHQFGASLANSRPSAPDFIGKGWNYVKEKRRSTTKEKKTKSASNLVANENVLLRRPNSTTSFLKVRYNEMSSDEAGFANKENGGYNGGGENCTVDGGHSASGTPKPVKRTSSVKRTRSMRCSPTVPDSMTLTVGMMNNVVMGASNTNALDALHKLTPAAPQLGKEPSFDEFFEEAERRNQTLEVLQAALTTNGAQTSSSSDGGCGGDISMMMKRVESESAMSRKSLNILPPTPPPSRKRSPVPSLTGIGISSASRSSMRLVENLVQIVSSSSSTSPEGADEEETLLLSPSTTKDKDSSQQSTTKSGGGGRVLIIVGGCEQDSFEEEQRQQRWDRCPPTIIVQPEHSSESFLFPPSAGPVSSSNSSSSSCLTTLASGGAITPGGGTPRSERRRGSVSPSGISSVRFADEIAVTQSSPPPTATEKQPSTDTSEKVQLRDSSGASRRIKHRSSLRRKTIGGIISLDEAAGATGGASNRTVDDSSNTSTATSQQHKSTKPLGKKSLSRSDVTQSPPLISLLTQPQILLVRQVWQQIYATKGPTVLGNHIFQRVVFKNPSVREVFRTVDIGNQCFNVDIMCKSHAKAVAAVLDDVIRSLDTPQMDAMDTRLIDVGRQHAVFHDLGFHLHFWSQFAEAFIDCTLEWGEKNRRVDEARKAWAIIIAHITDKMKLGYQEARRMSLPRIPSGRRIRMSETESTSASSSSAAFDRSLARSDSH